MARLEEHADFAFVVVQVLADVMEDVVSALIVGVVAKHRRFGTITTMAILVGEVEEVAIVAVVD